MTFAEKTDVSPERSKAEIETLVSRYGADQFASGWGPCPADSSPSPAFLD